MRRAPDRPLDCPPFILIVEIIECRIFSLEWSRNKLIGFS